MLGGSTTRDFGEVVATMGARRDEDLRAEAARRAPTRVDPVLPTLPCHADDDQHDPTRPEPIGSALDGRIDEDDLEWASHVGLSSMRRINEGAEFVRLAEDVFVITVRGAQPVHHDRHVSLIPNGEARGFSEHTWNVVAEPSDGQQLLCEFVQDGYAGFALDRDALVYMNTTNRHALSRRSPHDVVVIVQVDGYGPDDEEAAVARLAAVLAARPATLPL